MSFRNTASEACQNERERREGRRRRFATLMSGCLVVVSVMFASVAAKAAENNYSLVSPDGVEIAVQEFGNPAGPPIIFIHGLLGSHGNWESQVKSAELSRFRLITFDLRGHGLSGKPDEGAAYGNARRWADDLHTVVKATQVKSPVLVGWSLGGAVMTNYVATYGDDHLGGLLYVAGVVELSPQLMTAHPDVYGGLASEDAVVRLEATRKFLALCFARQPDEATFDRLLSNAALSSSTMVRHTPSMPVLAAGALPRVKVPVVMLYGEKDALVMANASIERATTLNPAIDTMIYTDSGHAPFLEEAERFNLDLVEFRDSIPVR
ncbi:alpha/beta fold hydrolase [Agrobacterium albertimagni]|nr:alpha/beta hydrolase [Agrobacterium albertimagni]